MIRNKGVILAMALATGVLGSPVHAEDQPAPSPDDAARVCDAYGPGYTVVPGTNTCIKISGFVRQDLNISGGGSGSPSSSSPPARN